MVEKVDTRGFRDWVIQRITAIIIAFYAIGLAVYCATNDIASYTTWHSLLSLTWFKLVTSFVLFSIIWHAWLGLWTVFTDYVQPKKLRCFLLFLVCVLLLAYLIGGCAFIWG